MLLLVDLPLVQQLFEIFLCIFFPFFLFLSFCHVVFEVVNDFVGDVIVVLQAIKHFLTIFSRWVAILNSKLVAASHAFLNFTWLGGYVLNYKFMLLTLALKRKDELFYFLWIPYFDWFGAARGYPITDKIGDQATYFVLPIDYSELFHLLLVFLLAELELLEGKVSTHPSAAWTH